MEGSFPRNAFIFLLDLEHNLSIVPNATMKLSAYNLSSSPRTGTTFKESIKGQKKMQ